MPTASLSSGKLFEPEQKASYFIDGRELVLDLNPERVENLEDGAVGGFDEIFADFLHNTGCALGRHFGRNGVDFSFV